jgi:hypothetical protein
MIENVRQSPIAPILRSGPLAASRRMELSWFETAQKASPHHEVSFF